MGAKTKSLFPAVQQYSETEAARTCECPPADGHYLPKNALKCRDNLCPECLRRVGNPRLALKYSSQRLGNIPILCHIQTLNGDIRRSSDFQRLLRAQRNSSFVDLLAQARHPCASPQYPRAQVGHLAPIFGSHGPVTAGSLKRTFGNIPPYVGSRPALPGHQSCRPKETARVPCPVQSVAGDKLSGDECIKSRIKDCDGYIRRAACVCVNETETKLVLVSSKNDGGGWLIPGGGLEDGEEEIVAAKREAWEEAGIKGRITRWLGVFQCEDETTKKKKKTSVFVLTVSEELTDFPEANLGRVRRWFDICEARKLLSICKPNQKAYLDALTN